MEFCSATRCHFDQIIEIVSSPEEMYLFYPNGRFPLDHPQLEELVQKRSNFTIGIDNDEVVGFANIYNIHSKDSAFIGNVFVANSYRGKGFGKKITEYMCELCISEHNATPHLSVFNNNTLALIMYSELGFKPYSIEQREDGNSKKVALIHMKLERLE